MRFRYIRGNDKNEGDSGLGNNALEKGNQKLGKLGEIILAIYIWKAQDPKDRQVNENILTRSERPHPQDQESE